MKLAESRTAFIQSWGKLGVEWGINRTMAQIHALLLVSPDPLDTDQVMEELAISRGNANTNLRALVDWGLVEREHRPGVRREFFRAEKDVWEISRRIVEQRRRRELDPLMQDLEELLAFETARGESKREARELRRVVKDVRELGLKAGRLLDLVLRLDRSTFFKPLLGLLKR